MLAPRMPARSRVSMAVGWRGAPNWGYGPAPYIGRIAEKLNGTARSHTQEVVVRAARAGALCRHRSGGTPAPAAEAESVRRGPWAILAGSYAEHSRDQ